MIGAAPWPLGAAAGALFAFAALAAQAADCVPAPGDGRSRPVRAAHAMVAAAHPAAVAAGCRVLARGGNAVDAAVAVQMTLAVVEPQASGPGGGSVLLHFDAARASVRFFDGVASAPAAANADLRAPLDAHDAQRCGRARLPRAVTVTGRAVGVPGTVAALALAHREHGALAWRELFDDAIAAARDGFALAPYMAALLAEPVDGTPRCAWPDLRARYCVDARTPRAVGSTLTNPDAARTLEQIRDRGVAGFVDAMAVPAAARVAAGACAPGASPAVIPGTLAAHDLARYRALERAPLCARVLGHRVCTAPPPSYGGLVLLRILDFMQRAGAAGLAPEGLDHAHRFVHASTLAQWERRQLIGDPDHAGRDPGAALAPAALEAAFAAFSAHRALPVGVPLVPGPASAPAPVQDETTHVSIVDALGNAVAMTSTNNKSFGAHLEAGGFVLNNALANFTSPRARGPGAVVNAMAPGARARTAMTPVLVFDVSGKLRAVAGGAGGAAIPDFVAQALLGVLVHGLEPVAALSLGHLSGQRLRAGAHGARAAVDLERGTPAAGHRDALEALGYTAVAVGRLRSGLALIQVDADGMLVGAADPRRDGAAAGY